MFFEHALDTDFEDVPHETCETGETGRGRSTSGTVCSGNPARSSPTQGMAGSTDAGRGDVETDQSGSGDVGDTALCQLARAAGQTPGPSDPSTLKHREQRALGPRCVLRRSRRRQQDRNGAANLAPVRQLGISLLRRETSNKRGTKNKRLRSAPIRPTSSK